MAHWNFSAFCVSLLLPSITSKVDTQKKVILNHLSYSDVSDAELTLKQIQI